MTVTIYALVDPRSDVVRYVGKTARATARRVAEHVQRAQRKPNCHRDFWLAQLLAAGFSPEVVVLESGEWSRLEACEREIYWIAEYRSRGVTLTNMTQGGDGVGGTPLTAAHRQKLSLATQAAWANTDHRAAHTAANRAIWNSSDLRELVGQQSKSRWANPEYAARATLQSADYRDRRSALAKAQAERPGGRERLSEMGRRGALKRRRCLECGYEHLASALGTHRKMTGHSLFEEVT